LFRQFLMGRGRWPVFVAGLATGFLPCGLVYAFLAAAVATGNVLKGMLVMACFGLGTVPAMAAIGCGSRVLSLRLRQHVFRLAACFVVLLGGATIYRAVATMGGRSCHEGSAVSAGSLGVGSDTPPCCAHEPADH